MLFTYHFWILNPEFEIIYEPYNMAHLDIVNVDWISTWIVLPSSS